METIIRAPVVSSEPWKLHTGASRAGLATRETAPATAQPVQSSILPDTAPGAPPSAEQQAQANAAARLLHEQDLANAFALAERQGFESGRAKGEEAVRSAFNEQIKRMASITAALYQAKAEALADAEDLMVEIVYAAVCRILGDRAVTREGVAGAVEQALLSFRHGDEVVVRLHPQDAGLLQQELGSAAIVPVSVREDPSISLGGCIVDSGKGSLDARLDIQLAALRDTLLAVRRQRIGSEEAR